MHAQGERSGLQYLNWSFSLWEKARMRVRRQIALTLALSRKRARVIIGDEDALSRQDFETGIDDISIFMEWRNDLC
jgi:hypothetical protein